MRAARARPRAVSGAAAGGHPGEQTLPGEVVTVSFVSPRSAAPVPACSYLLTSRVRAARRLLRPWERSAAGSGVGDGDSHAGVADLDPLGRAGPLPAPGASPLHPHPDSRSSGQSSSPADSVRRARSRACSAKTANSPPREDRTPTGMLLAAASEANHLGVAVVAQATGIVVMLRALRSRRETTGSHPGGQTCWETDRCGEALAELSRAIELEPANARVLCRPRPGERGD